jgi:hypothetical protein
MYRSTRARAASRESAMVNFLALFCLALVCMMGFEALIIADLVRITGCKP